MIPYVCTNINSTLLYIFFCKLNKEFQEFHILYAFFLFIYLLFFQSGAVFNSLLHSFPSPSDPPPAALPPSLASFLTTVTPVEIKLPFPSSASQCLLLFLQPSQFHLPICLSFSSTSTPSLLPAAAPFQVKIPLLSSAPMFLHFFSPFFLSVPYLLILLPFLHPTPSSSNSSNVLHTTLHLSLLTFPPTPFNINSQVHPPFPPSTAPIPFCFHPF